MEILRRECGAVEENAYIVKLSSGIDFIIDPGFSSSEWVLENAKNPKAILITHGHYDHVWDSAQLLKALKDTPIYAPKDDVFMLENDIFHLGMPVFSPNFSVPCNKGCTTLEIENTAIKYWHFPGHTPGCSIIEIEGVIFSGDFIFYRSIGRYDFPYSNEKDMKESLLRFQNLDFPKDIEIYPGHGDKTSFFAEREHSKIWVSRMA
ncbi:MBL fold metallo-hydrolase [Helicobacter pylori]|uniref:MBL fold metallo-hydrolase n=1 Tax=Helicobacter pylori TaxID=210 RepID=UPI0012E9802B|nr:MBL fold metallo-hydrolase [Helicobacter pylori]MUU55421.1 MBL fold metallo-hydrolase [Helicobacter pylori]WQV78263.1 MBL fold metallo-hydrolase [Helicobacter pylori]